MEHSEAVQQMATERYLLNEMTPAERQAFEEHYFDCADCAREVRDGAVFLGSGRELAREQQREKKRPEVMPNREPRVAWWAVAAGVVLLTVVGYQNGVQIPRLRSQPQAALLPAVLHPASFLSAGNRGAADIEIERVGMQPMVLSVDIPPDAAAARYLCEVRDAAGRVHASIPVTTEEARDNVLLSLPAHALASGSYRLVIRAVHADGSVVDLATYPFSLRVQ